MSAFIWRRGFRMSRVPTNFTRELVTVYILELGIKLCWRTLAAVKWRVDCTFNQIQ